jgi:hypothetical protein
MVSGRASTGRPPPCLQSVMKVTRSLQSNKTQLDKKEA